MDERLGLVLCDHDHIMPPTLGGGAEHSLDALDALIGDGVFGHALYVPALA